MVGTATNLYSTEFRRAVETVTFSVDQESSRGLATAVLPAVVASGVTAAVLFWLARRRQQVPVATHTLTIEKDVFNVVESDSDAVSGRPLRYLETTRSSDELVVLLHGLGLDASDFEPYMAQSTRHCIALTFYGFNASERNDEHFKPISLQSHVQLVGYAIGKFREMYPHKKITLVGFSFGADVLCLMPTRSPTALDDAGIARIILLDPNVDHTTTTISARISMVSNDRPLSQNLDQLVKLLESADSLSEFRYLCEYLYKITEKNFDQIQRFAQEVVDVWKTETTPDLFLDYVGRLMSITPDVQVVLSLDHDQLFNKVVRGAIARNMSQDCFDSPGQGHFELIEPPFLKEMIEERQRPRGWQRPPSGQRPGGSGPREPKPSLR